MKGKKNCLINQETKFEFYENCQKANRVGKEVNYSEKK